jgi:hypothetical protein
MASYCTCGAALAPDSLFCHKCGKPQRDIPEYVPEVVEAEPEPVADPVVVRQAERQAEQPPVNFHNRLAIQIGLIMAVLATLASFLVYFNYLAAGFFTVIIYRRRTGYPLDMRAGVRLGWITGILMFVIMMVILTASIVFISSGGLNGLPPEVTKALDPRVLESLKTLKNGPVVAQMMIMLFAFTTLLSMAGGALGAKLASRGQQ